ncbi:MAG TPA: hypothetical protein VFS20_33835 [Longimicrobium sp.]|nr:hypothetical protein [Longimicrobium sp.]
MTLREISLFVSLRRVWIATLALLSACGTVRPATTPAVLDAEAEVVAAERAFAAAAARDGIRGALLAFAHDGAVALQPEPRDAKELWRARPRTSARLAWYPAFARAARSGDLGFTTGPYQGADSASRVTDHGQYVTVWKKTEDGWRFLVYVGSPHPRPGAPQPEWRPSHRSHASGPVATDGADASLLAADSGFAAHAAARGFASALEAYGDREIRLLRPRAMPRVGMDGALAAALADSARHYTARPVHAMASAAGDLGWSWGEYELVHPGAGRHETGHYVRLWSREPGGRWRVLLDVVAPRPAERDE